MLLGRVVWGVSRFSRPLLRWTTEFSVALLVVLLYLHSNEYRVSWNPSDADSALWYRQTFPNYVVQPGTGGGYQCFQPGIPTYFISLEDASPRFQAAIDALGQFAHWVPALAASNLTQLYTYFPNGTFDSIEDMKTNNFAKLRRSSDPTDLAVYMSHMKALNAAYDGGAPYTLIVEDDLGFHMACLWPANLTTVITQAERLYPGWHVLRLKVGASMPDLIQLKKDWMLVAGPQVRRMSNDAKRKRALTYGKWGPDIEIPLSMPYAEGYSAEARVWSRAGLETYLRKLGAGEPGKIQQFKWPETECVSDHIGFWNIGDPKKVLVSTPPLLSARLYEKSDARSKPRKSSTDLHQVVHHMDHAFVTQWLIETAEIFRPPYFGMEDPGVPVWTAHPK